MRDDLVQHSRRIARKLKHATPNRGVEWLLKWHRARVACNEANVGHCHLLRASNGCLDGGRRPIDPDDLTCRPHETRGQKRDIADAAADIQYAHARFEAGVAQESLSERLIDARLEDQSFDFSVGMAKHILPASPLCAHARPPCCSVNPY